MLQCKLHCRAISHLTQDEHPLYEIILPEEKVEITFTSFFKGDYFLVDVQNGGMHGAHKVTDEPLDISEYIFAGRLEITVSMVACGRVAKKWYIAPVAIVEKEHDFHAFDELADLQRRVADLEEKTKITM